MSEVRSAGRKRFAVAFLLLATGTSLTACGASEEEKAIKEEEAENRNVMVRVSGTEGTAYSGTYGTDQEVREAEGVVEAEPRDYDLGNVDFGDFDEEVNAVFRKTETGRGNLRMEILVDGEPIAVEETNEELGEVELDLFL